MYIYVVPSQRVVLLTTEPSLPIRKVVCQVVNLFPEEKYHLWLAQDLDFLDSLSKRFTGVGWSPVS